ncbi:hypothetical protein [Mesorhizobium sp. IMUNJ 23232]|uniref:hypothetical protein n=1 Tax=Mesorhizobium sp. IMUNJ 23232 TaxID=3376064 RepID=UPI0037B9DC4B
MLTSTFAALRLRGIRLHELREATATNFDTTSHIPARFVDGVPDEAMQAFWQQMILARRAYRKESGHNIEQILGK